MGERHRRLSAVSFSYGLPHHCRRAGIEMTADAIFKLRDRHRTKDAPLWLPSRTRVTRALEGTHPQKRATITPIVEVLRIELEKRELHTCVACRQMTDFNSIVPGFGGFVRHIQGVTEHRKSDVIGTLVAASNYAADTITTAIKGQSLPFFVAQRLAMACHACFGNEAARWKLQAITASARELLRPDNPIVYGLISLDFTAQFFTPECVA